MMSMNTKQAAAAAKSGYSTKELVLDAMFIALTYVFTAFVNVRNAYRCQWWTDPFILYPYTGKMCLYL